MRKLALVLCMSIGLVTAHVHAQAPPPTDRKVYKTEAAAYVATPSFPLTAQAAPLAVIVALQGPVAESPPARPVVHPSRVGPAKVYVVAEVVAPPDFADSLFRSAGSYQVTEPKRQLRPDPGRHRKGYNYR